MGVVIRRAPPEPGRRRPDGWGLLAPTTGRLRCSARAEETGCASGPHSMLGVPGRVTAPGPDLFRTWISRPARFLMPGWRPPATTLCAARKQPSTGDQKVRKQAPEQVRLQVPTDDRDQTVGGCSYAALARAWRNGSYEGCEDLRPQCAASRASATPQPDTRGGRRGAHCTRLGSIRRPRRCQRRHGGQMGARREATQPVLPAPLRAAVRRVPPSSWASGPLGPATGRPRTYSWSSALAKAPRTRCCPILRHLAGPASLRLP